MNDVFADTSFYVAFLNPRDSLHARAAQLAQSLRGRVVTSEYVLIETGNYLSRSGDRQSFVALVQQLRAAPNVEIKTSSPDLFARGFELYSRRADKQWSLTDCLSFVVMQDMVLTDALTADHHFEQAGFIALMK